MDVEPRGKDDEASKRTRSRALTYACECVCVCGRARAQVEAPWRMAPRTAEQTKAPALREEW